MLKTVFTATATARSLQSCPTLCDPIDLAGSKLDYRVINMELIIIVHIYIDRHDKLLELSIIPYSLHSFSCNLMFTHKVSWGLHTHE